MRPIFLFQNIILYTGQYYEVLFAEEASMNKQRESCSDPTRFPLFGAELIFYAINSKFLISP